MANMLKGNLGLKSSPLAPTSSKLTTQFLVLDHMNSHFNKITKAKSAIDNKPPKSLQTSQKMRDRKNRTRIISSPRNHPTVTMSQDEIRRYQDILNDEPEDEEERLVHSIMRSTLNDKPKGSNNATYGSQSQETYMSAHTIGDTQSYPNRHTQNVTRPLSARSTRSIQSCMSIVSSRVPITHDTTRITYNGDIMEKRAHKFTEPDRPFTPRTNKSSHESRLKNSKCYNPPKSSAKKSSVEENTQPKAEQRRRKSYCEVSSTYSAHNTQNGLDTGQLSESMLMDVTLQSRDDHSNHDSSTHQIPRLDISMDKDHINWLQEQASKAKVRARGGAKLRPTQNDVIVEESSPGGLNRSIKMETLKREEEQKYLAFAKEVTDDVLARGICSERVLHRMFESHIDRRRHELDETQMRHVIQDLRLDLGLRESSQERNSGGGFSNNNNVSHVRPGSSGGRSSVSSASMGQTVQGNKLSVKKDSLNFSRTNDHTIASLDPVIDQASYSEEGLGATLDSTSTMQFGRTGDMFSTINSEATLEEREARIHKGEITKEENDEFSATQALKQYQFNLKAKEAGGEASKSTRESSTPHSNGHDMEGSEESQKLERAATGERQPTDEEDARSETSSFKAESSQRQRRNWLRKNRTKVSSNESSQLSSSDVMKGTKQSTTNEEYVSGESVIENAISQSGRDKAKQSEMASEKADDTESMKSSSSSQPVAKPRSSAKAKPAVPDSEPVGVEDGREKDSSSDHYSERVESEGKGDPSTSSALVDSGLGSAQTAPGHGDTRKDVSEAVKSGGQGQSAQKGKYTGDQEDPDDEYEDDYDTDEDGGHGLSTHRTSDDDF